MYQLLQRTVLASILILLLVPFAAKASFSTNGIGDDSGSLSILLTPAHPKSGESVSAELQSTLTNLDQAKITWTVNGKIAGSGLALKSMQLGTAAATPTSVLITILTGSTGDLGPRVLEKSFSIQAEDLSLAWQADSSVPPFFEGKALLPPQGNGEAIAIPNAKDASGKSIPASQLTYSWSLNGTPDAKQSGLGKTSFSFSGQILGVPAKVSVEASSPDGSWVGTDSAIIGSTDPQVLIYEDNPIEGTSLAKTFNLSQSLASTTSLLSPEISLSAVPYYFSADPSTLSFQWYMNGSPMDNQASQVATLRNNQKVGGVTDITAEAHLPGTIFQGNLDSFSLNLPIPGIGTSASSSSSTAKKPVNPF